MTSALQLLQSANIEAENDATVLVLALRESSEAHFRHALMQIEGALQDAGSAKAILPPEPSGSDTVTGSFRWGDREFGLRFDRASGRMCFSSKSRADVEELGATLWENLYVSTRDSNLPRWAQVAAGLFLLPITALCVAGAVSIFGVPKVQSDPMLQFFAGAICLMSVWALLLAIRLLFGLGGRNGFFGPVALRIIAAAAIGLVIGGAFTGVYVEHPLRSSVLVISYLLIAVRLWQLAARRSRTAVRE
ncbi:MAG TPA: hypothetical protein VMZ90_12640 [Vicinamibacterales bacterium]|nr:hypothetical protein [Vicinamibacterales bacterium]